MSAPDDSSAPRPAPVAFGRGSACGKAILIGEHAVVYGTPAIALGLSLGASATAQSAAVSSITVGTQSARAGDGSELARALEAMLEELALPPCALEVTVTLPLGSGLGGSAAIGVAAARAALDASARTASAADVLRGAAAWESVFHGNPSGVDAASAFYGGCIWYSKSDGVRALPLARPLELGICLAGAPASTKAMVDGVRARAERRPDLFGKTLSGIESLSKNARLCLQQGDLGALGQLMNYNQMLLSGLFVSTPEIERACAIARSAGALGAKLTGAGGGGAVIALAENDASSIVAAWQEAGYRTYVARVAAVSPKSHDLAQL
jgi:mevalonate kinase